MVDKSLPFAQALLSIGQDNKQEDQYLVNLNELKKMFEEVDQLRLVLSHPGVDRKTKENILIETCQDSMDSSFIDFLKVACRQNMAGQLPQIADHYAHLLDESRNIQTVKITSSIELDEKQKAKLTTILQNKLNGKVKLECVVDPTLIAGMKIQTEDAILDASYLKALEKMKEQLTKS